MTRLSWNEIKLRAINFSREHKTARYEKGETQTFYNEFFNVFGITRRRVATFEEPARKLGDKKGFIDLFWRGTLIIEQKSQGRDLTRAYGQALDYFPGIEEADLPRFVLVSDFQNFVLHDLDLDEHHHFTLAEFPTKIRLFAFMLGLEERKFDDQDPVNIKASELMGRLHDALYESNYRGHDLELLLIRLLFCLFADDTGIFPTRGMFLNYIIDRTSPDGHDLGTKLAELFQVLNEQEANRQNNLDEDLSEFPYVNGDLFERPIRLPTFTSGMRQILIEACRFDWERISPAIFGALFQSVLDPIARRKQGAHYTSEKNILKVIEPLFLDDLRQEFRTLQNLREGSRKNRLKEFHQTLATKKFFDPACGCGNFLIIAYREIRKLEHQLLAEIYPEDQRALDLSTQIRTSVDQFFGIELDEFPARIAEVALYMMDHIMNNEAANQFGEAFPSVPIKKSPHIHYADALVLDWSKVTLPQEGLYIFGNPPFIGAKVQSEAQRAQIRRIANLGKSGGTLDYVAVWFILAARFAHGKNIPIAFVATNSITQGEQVAQLWPIILDQLGYVITFAHRTFVWRNEARGIAKVHCVIIGLSRGHPDKRIYLDSDDQITIVRAPNISPYLVPASSLTTAKIIVKETSICLSGMPKLISGTQPIDNGEYILTELEYQQFIEREPNSAKFFRPYLGSQELINGGPRWFLFLKDARPEELRAMPTILEKMKRVSLFRSKSSRQSTLAISNQPTKLNVEVFPNSPFLAFPEVSSERREYVPFAYLEPPTIPSNLLKVLLDAKLHQFALLISSMHMAWLREIGGRLESRYRYSIGVVYNTFPWPTLDEKAKARLDSAGQAILDARANHPGATLADLYDPLTMPDDLRKAHQANDRLVERLYRKEPFTSDMDRVAFLLAEYEKLVAPLEALANAKPKRQRRKSLTP